MCTHSWRRSIWLCDRAFLDRHLFLASTFQSLVVCVSRVSVQLAISFPCSRLWRYSAAAHNPRAPPPRVVRHAKIGAETHRVGFPARPRAESAAWAPPWRSGPAILLHLIRVGIHSLVSILSESSSYQAATTTRMRRLQEMRPLFALEGSGRPGSAVGFT